MERRTVKKKATGIFKDGKMSFVVKTNGEMFQKYLDIQSRFNRNSVGNCLIILTDKPNAMQFKDKKSWKELNVNVKAYNEPFTILEPEEKMVEDISTQKMYLIYHKQIQIYQTIKIHTQKKNYLQVIYMIVKQKKK